MAGREYWAYWDNPDGSSDTQPLVDEQDAVEWTGEYPSDIVMMTESSEELVVDERSDVDVFSQALRAQRDALGYPLHVRYIPEAGVEPGDLILTRTKGRAGWWIRLAAAFRNKPNLVNHVIVVHHEDKAGRLWGIEGRPGGVGWVVIDDHILKNPYTMDNRKQAKTGEQRQKIVDGALQLIDTEYSWKAIVGDGLDVVGFPNPWDRLWEEGAPSQLVCSSMADWLYWEAGLETPHNDENCTPGDWAEFFVEQGWV